MAKDASLLISRILVVFIFLHAGIDKIRHWSDTIAYMQHYNVPLIKFSLAAAIIIEVVGAFLIILGLKSRYAAVLLMIYLVVITAFFHNIIKEPQQMINFLKNIAILGSLLSIAIHGHGKFGFDKEQ